MSYCTVNFVGKFRDGIYYTYDQRGLKVEVDDYVICETRYGYGLAQIVAYDLTRSEARDLTGYEGDCKKLVGLVDCINDFERARRIAERKAELLKEMQAAITEAQALQMIESQAGNNAEVAALLNEYKELEND